MPHSSLCASGTQAVFSSHLRSVPGLLHGPLPPIEPLPPQPQLVLPYPPHPPLVLPHLNPSLPLFASWALTEPRGPPVPVCAIVTHKWRSCSSSTLAEANGSAVLVQVHDHDRPVLGATRPTQHTTGQGLAQLGGSCLLGDSLCGGKPAGSPNPNHKRAPCVLTLQKNGMQADKCVMVHTVTVHT